MGDAARPGTGLLGITVVELRLRHLSRPEVGPAQRDPRAVAGMPSPAGPDRGRVTLLKLAAMIAIGASAAAYGSVLGSSDGDAPSADAALGTMVAVAPVVGLARLVSAAPALAQALGYDVDAALELHDPAAAPQYEPPELVRRAIGQGAPP